MTYIAAQARQELLDAIVEATDRIAAGLADLGVAYELLDEYNGDRLEAELFRPVQTAYGRAKRTCTGFAERHGLPAPRFAAGTPGAPSHGAKVLIEIAVDATGDADTELATLQDSMRPVEVGDPELRAGLAETREILGGLRGRARDFVRTLGR